jgi:hypothetical protein
MNHTDYRTLLNRGRKAGLNTRELYQALSSRRPEEADQLNGQTDGNGYISSRNQAGQRVYLPGGELPRS